MSFLNPVNEPVKRFSSTDADAPQINYAARIAGDVKAVLKACLVTGYGATESAGWSIVNEVDHVCEFVSPSVAMSDYRLGIDDTSTSSTTWYYQYQDARVNPRYNSPVKSFTAVNKAHVDNGWELLATNNGFYFIELVQNSHINKISARLTYLGQVKLALIDTSKNLSFFNVGHDGAYLYNKYFFDRSNYTHIDTAAGENSSYFGPLISSSTSAYDTFDLGSTIEPMSELYIKNNLIFVGQQPGIVVKQVSGPSKMYGVAELNLEGRPCLQITLGARNETNATKYGVVVLLRLDSWSM